MTQTVKITVPKAFSQLQGSKLVHTADRDTTPWIPVGFSSKNLVAHCPGAFQEEVLTSVAVGEIIGIFPKSREALVLFKISGQYLIKKFRSTFLFKIDSFERQIQQTQINEELFQANFDAYDPERLKMVQKSQEPSYFSNKSVEFFGEIMKKVPEKHKNLLKEIMNDYKQTISRFCSYDYEMVFEAEHLSNIYMDKRYKKDKTEFQNQANIFISELQYLKCKPEFQYNIQVTNTIPERKILAARKLLAKSAVFSPKYYKVQHIITIIKFGYERAVLSLKTGKFPNLSQIYGIARQIYKDYKFDNRQEIDMYLNFIEKQHIEQEIQNQNLMQEDMLQQFILNEVNNDITPQLPFLKAYLIYVEYFIPFCKLLFVKILKENPKADYLFDCIVKGYLYLENSNLLIIGQQKLLTLPKIVTYSGQSKIMLNQEIEEFKKVCTDTNKINRLSELITLQRDIFILIMSLLQIGINLHPTSHYNEFPFHITILCEMDQDRQMQTKPHIHNAVSYFAKYFGAFFKNLHELDFSKFMNLNLQNYSCPKQLINNEFKNLTIFEDQEYINQKINDGQGTMESTMTMISDIILNHLSVSKLYQEFEEIKYNGELKQFIQFIDEIKLNNQQLANGDHKFDEYIFIQILTQQKTLPSFNLQQLFHLINVELLNKFCIASLFSKEFYYYLYKLDVQHLKQVLMEEFNRFKLFTLNTLKQLYCDFSINIIQNMRLIEHTLHEYERRPEMFLELKNLGSVFDAQKCKTFYSHIFDYTQKMCLELQNVYPQSHQPELINNLYVVLQDIIELEQYIQLRQVKEKPTYSQKYKDLEFCKDSEISQLLQKRWIVFQKQCDEVEFNYLDDVQLPTIAFHKLTREVQLSLAVLQQRSGSYSVFLTCLNTNLHKTLAKASEFVRSNLFKGVSVQNTSNEKINENQDKHTIDTTLSNKSLNKSLSDVQKEEIKLFEQPQILLELNEENATQLQKKFELEFLSEFQRHVRMQLCSTNYKNDQISVMEISKENKLIVHILSLSQSSLYIKQYATSINTLLNTITEILLLYRLYLQWNDWLQTPVTQHSILIESIHNMIELLAPIQQIFNNYLIIMVTHDQAQNLYLSSYPYKAMQFRLFEYLQSTINFKQNFKQFLGFIEKQSIQFNNQFLGIIDNMSNQILKILPEINICCAFTHSFILPQQLSDISKHYCFIDNGLSIKVSDLLAQQTHATFYSNVIQLTKQSQQNQLIFTCLESIYKHMKQYKLTFEIDENNQIKISMQPTAFCDAVSKYLVFMSVLINSYQNQISSQVLIFARDLESILLSSKEVYYIVMRMQNLLIDMQYVKSNGKVVVLDFNELFEENVAKITQKPTTRDKRQKKTEKLTDLQLSIQYLKEKLQKQQEKIENRKLLEINILSGQDQMLINTAHQQLKDLCLKFIQKDSSIISLHGNYAVLKNLQKSVVELDLILKKLKVETYGSIFRTFSNKQQQRLNNLNNISILTYYDIFEMGQEQKILFNQQLVQIDLDQEIREKQLNRQTNYQQYKLLQSQLVAAQYPSHGMIIPIEHGYKYSQQLIYDTPILQQYGDFMLNYMLFIKDIQLNKLFFDNITAFIIEESPTRGQILTKIQSFSETLPLKVYAKCPDVMFKFPDLVYEQIPKTLYQNVVNGIELLMQDDYEKFISQIVYQAQICCIHQCDTEKIKQLRTYLSNQKKQEYIPIMCRLEELNQLGTQNYFPKLQIQDQSIILFPEEIKTGNIYLGCPKQIEYQMLNSKQLQTVAEIFKGIKNRNTIFLCRHYRENLQTKKNMEQVQAYISRYLYRKVVKLFFSEFSFVEQFRQLVKLTLTGHIVIIYDIITISAQQLAILVDYLVCIQNRQGAINSIFQVDLNLQKVKQLKEKLEKNQEIEQSENLSEDDVILRNADFKDFGDSLGYVLFSVNCVDDLNLESNISLSKDQNVLILQDSAKYTVLFNQFNDTMLLNVSSFNQEASYDIVQKEYLQANAAFGLKVYNLSNLMDRFDDHFSKLHPSDVSLVTNLINNANDPLIVSTCLLDLLLRQYVDEKVDQSKLHQRYKLTDGFQEFSENNEIQCTKINHQLRIQQKNMEVNNAQQINFTLLSNITASIFGLNKKQQSQLVTQSKAYSYILDRSRQAVGAKALTFAKYYQQFIHPVLTTEATKFIMTFQLTTQVNIGIAYEVFLLTRLLQLKKPILIDCFNIQYMITISILLQNISMKKTFVVCTYFDFIEILKEAKTDDLLCIIATSLNEFKRIQQKIREVDSNLQTPKILINLPRGIEQDLLQRFERRFCLLPDLTDCLQIGNLLCCNKIFKYSSIKVQYMTTQIKEQSRYQTSMENKENLITQLKLYRLTFVQNVFLFTYNNFMNAISKIFNIGLNFDEFLLLRSISDFFLLRFNVLKVNQDAKQNIKQIQEAGQSPQPQKEEIINQELLQKSERSYDLMQTLNRAYCVNYNNSKTNYQCFNQDELQNKQKNVSKTLSENGNIGNIIEILSEQLHQGGKGQIGSIKFELNEDYLLNNYLSFNSCYEAVLNLMKITCCATLNAALLLSQFQQNHFLPNKKYEQFQVYLKDYEPERLNQDIQAEEYLSLIIQVIMFEHQNGIYDCQYLEIKNKYTSQQNLVKSFYNKLQESIPQFAAKQFSYLSMSAQQEIQFESYQFGRGILKNIETDKFMKIRAAERVEKTRVQVAEQSEQQEASEENVEECLQQMDNMSQYHTDDFENDNIQFEQSKQTAKQMLNQFQKQFDLKFMNTIDIQQQEQALPIYLDDERIALSVLMACCMITPITVGLYGEPFTGKSLILKTAKMIVRDICLTHQTVLKGMNSIATTHSFQQYFLSYYIKVSNPVIQQIYSSKYKRATKSQEELRNQILLNYQDALKIFENTISNSILEQNQEIDNLKKCFKSVTNMKHQLNFDQHQSQAKYENTQQENNQGQVNDYVQTPQNILLYNETQAFPCFILNCSQMEIDQNLNDSMLQLLRDHSMALNIINEQTFLSSVQLDSMINKQIGALDLSDTSFIIEFQAADKLKNLNSQNITNTFNICFQIPTINMSYLRKYFRYLQSYGFTGMTEEWVQSFLNGLTLISSDLPTKMFENYLFFRRVLAGYQFHLPSYKKIITDQKRIIRLEQQHVQIGFNRMMEDMKPDIWSRIVSNYDQYNTNLEKRKSEIKFIDYLKDVIQSLKHNKAGGRTKLQSIMGYNQDHVFESLNIYTLINALKNENIANSRILNMLERFTSLNLLGYLQFIKRQEITAQTQKIKILHPWQDTQKHSQLYTSLQAVLVQLLLVRSREKQQNSLVLTLPVDKAFANKFSQSMFKYQSPLTIDQDKVKRKIPYKKIFKAFLYPNQDEMTYQVLIDQFLQKRGYNLLFNAGLMASNMIATNSFFMGHIIHQYSLCANNVDPLLMQFVFQLCMQIDQIKQKNTAILKTQIMSYTIYDVDSQNPTGHHAVDYLSNFKKYTTDVLGLFVTTKAGCQQKLEEKEDEKDQHIIETSEVEEQNEFESDSQSEVIHNEQKFGGFQQTMLNALVIPQFKLKLNSNASQHQYNIFIQLFSLIGQYKVMSNEFFKEVFSKMSKTDQQLEEADISDNQSVASKASSQNSKYSSASKNSVASTQFNDEYNAEQQQIGQAGQDNMNIYQMSPRAFRFFTNRRHDKKLIVDIQNILQTLSITTTVNKNKKTKHDISGTMDLINYLKQFMNELQQHDTISVDGIEYLVILQIIRFSILLALGIKPTLVFNPNQYQKSNMFIPYSTQTYTSGITINSTLQQSQPVSQLQQGRLYGDLGIIPSQVQQRTQIYQKWDKQKFYDKLSGVSYPDYDPASSEQLKSKISDFYDVLIITPRSVLWRQSQYGTSMFYSLQQLLQSDSFLQQIFDYEELQNILKIMSVQMGFNYHFSLRDLQAFLSIMLAVVVVDDEPVQANQEFSKSQLNENNFENLGQIQSVIEMYSNALEISKQQQTSTRALIDATQFNSVDFKHSDITFLFNISKCPLPNEYVFPTKIHEDYLLVQQEYAQCLVTMYKTFQEFTSGAIVSFFEFSTMACSLVNNQNLTSSKLFSLLNYIYILGHFVETMATPAQAKPKVVETSVFTLEQVQKEIVSSMNTNQSTAFDFRIIGQLVKLLNITDEQINNELINSKSTYKNFNQQFAASTSEHIMVRNFLFSIIEKMRLQYKIYEQYQRSAQYDGILSALYLLFGQSGIVPEQKMFDYLCSGKLAKTFGQCQVVLNEIQQKKLQEITIKYDLFLIFSVSLMQNAGFYVDISNEGVNLGQVITKDKPVTVCQNTYLSNSIHNQIINLNAFDVPVLPIMKQLKISQKDGDPDLINLYNLIIYSQVLQKHTFLIEQNILTACACLLESLKKKESGENTYIKQVQQVIDDASKNQKEDSQKRNFVSDLLKKLIILDLQSPPREFNALLARLISISDNLIIFANFGPKANIDNCATMRKFLQLRARKVIDKRQTIYIGNSASVCNLQLHKFNVIISHAPNIDLQAELSRMGLYNQEFIDQLVLLGTYKQINVQEVENPSYICQSILQAVFTERSTTRYFTEEYRLLLTQQVQLLNLVKKTVQKYFWFNVFEEEFRQKKIKLIQQQIAQQQQFDQQQKENDQDVKESIKLNDSQINVTDEEFNIKVNSYLNSEVSVIKTGMRVSYVLNSSYQQIEEFNSVILALKNLVEVETQKEQFLNQNVNLYKQDNKKDSRFKEILTYRSPKIQYIGMKKYDSPLQAKHKIQYVVQTIGRGYCYQVSLCISYVLIEQLFQQVCGRRLIELRGLFYVINFVETKQCQACQYFHFAPNKNNANNE
ncbi:Conserved_hypothetical protein [Hexamita inflata]|uniref:Uncharacterized protein n=1 Tax=Hexamita inflata TaxID=28002 RepID=A0AA86QV58_9EUKA|nr:Conserved hypothetical protein [Hexamita inflata]